jgi:hypothetical protein
LVTVWPGKVVLKVEVVVASDVVVPRLRRVTVAVGATVTVAVAVCLSVVVPVWVTVSFW